MPRKTVQPPGTSSKAPLSLAVRSGDFLYLSGHVPTKDGQVVTGGIGPQTHQTFKNLIHTLEHAGASLDDVIKVNVFLTDMSDFSGMNEVYREYLPTDPPARSTVGTSALALPGLLIEIEMIAYLGDE
ncbi:MAG: RidA family protein [Trueperaceae bacterium]|nr:MAG: RidA family protein [Trueperaceae bacterium]